MLATTAAAIRICRAMITSDIDDYRCVKASCRHLGSLDRGYPNSVDCALSLFGWRRKRKNTAAIAAPSQNT
jgi:hypothetical protein